MKKSLLIFAFLYALKSFAQFPMAGSGNTLVLDNFDNSVAQNTAIPVTSYPITITAWIYADPIGGITNMPIYLSKDDPQRNRGFQFGLNQYNGSWFLEFSVGDGTTLDAMSQNARSVPFPNLQTWTHVAAVATGPQDVLFYINGVLIPSILQSNNGAGLVTTGPGLPRIGGSARAGTPFFRGNIDELTVFSSVRLLGQIRDHVCRKTPLGSPGLQVYFKMDEPGGITFQNSGPSGGNGTATVPNRAVSGAHIGDNSVHMYGTNLGGLSLQLVTTEGDSISVENYSGNSQTIHIYAVNSLPNHFNGLPQTTCILNRYFGVFTTEPFSPNAPLLNSYLVKYRNPDYFGQDNYRRFGNDDPLWNRIFTVNLANGFNFVTNFSREFILAKNLEWESNLPDSIITCSMPITLTSDTVAGVPLLWSTGASTSSITVNQGGMYWVQVSDTCNTITDTVYVIDLSNLNNIAQQFSLADQLVGTGCNYPVLLSAPNFPQVSHRWPNGSTGPTYTASPGVPIYLELFSVCDTTITDTLLLPTRVPYDSGLPPVIPVCDFPTTIQAAAHPYASLVWSTGDTGTTATVSTAGWVYVEITDSCETHRDSVQVQIAIPPAINPESLADQWSRVSCYYPFTFSFSLPQGTSIMWHDGSTNPSYTARQNGSVSVIIYSDCDTLFSDAIQLELIEPAATERQFEETVCPGFPITLEPDYSAGTYLWSEGASTRTIDADEPGFYSVYSIVDCDTIRNIFLLQLGFNCPALQSTLYVPSAFTPNDDGKNDIFRASGTFISNFHLIIFNRWGQKVFETRAIENGWDGSLPGGDFAQEGVYTYVIYYSDVFQRPQNQQGMITLMR